MLILFIYRKNYIYFNALYTTIKTLCNFVDYRVSKSMSLYLLLNLNGVLAENAKCTIILFVPKMLQLPKSLTNEQWIFCYTQLIHIIVLIWYTLCNFYDLSFKKFQ